MAKAKLASVENILHEKLQEKLQYHFKDMGLLERALTHRSFAQDHNERLEFLGDAVLNLAVAKMLYVVLETQAEGDLSRIRANLVKQETLHQLALELDLSPMLRLGEGELKTGGAKRPSILADALEALIAAVHLDAGFEKAFELVTQLYDKVEINPQMQAASKDPKTELQEWLQGKRLALPEYQVVGVTGAAHQQIFEVQCTVSSQGAMERGLGNSRRAAEQDAASKVVQFLKRLA